MNINLRDKIYYRGEEMTLVKAVQNQNGRINVFLDTKGEALLDTKAGAKGDLLDEDFQEIGEINLMHDHAHNSPLQRMSPGERINKTLIEKDLFVDVDTAIMSTLNYCGSCLAKDFKYPGERLFIINIEKSKLVEGLKRKTRFKDTDDESKKLAKQLRYILKNIKIEEEELKKINDFHMKFC